MVVTDLLSRGVSAEHARYLVGRARPSTIRLCDRRARKVTHYVGEHVSV